MVILCWWWRWPKAVDFLFCIVKLNLGAGGGGLIIMHWGGWRTIKYYHVLLLEELPVIYLHGH